MARPRTVFTAFAFILLSFHLSEAAVVKNLVSDWNAVTQAVVRQYSVPSQIATRYYTLVHLSIYKTLAGTPQLSKVSKSAAANYAAHYVLSTLFPTLQSSVFDGYLSTQLKLVSLVGVSTANSATYGKSYAIQLLKERANDGSQKFVNFVPSPAGGPAGKYAYTPGQTYVAYPQLATTKPFLVVSLSNYDPKPSPPKVYSAAYNKTVTEVRRLGRDSSAVRTAKQTETANFWADLAGTAQISGHWFNITKTLLPASSSLLFISKAYALVAVAQFDASIVAWNQKYKILNWRPVTAIRRDFNPTWTPYLSTPPHPEYPSGHSATSGSSAYVLAAHLGSSVYKKRPSFTISSEFNGNSLPARTYTTLNAVVVEIGLSRIYGGIHFRTAVEDGNTLGYKVGKAVYGRFDQIKY